MTDQPTTFTDGDTTKLAPAAVRAHITVALRNLVDPEDLNVVDGSDSIFVRLYGRTVEITTRDVTDQL